MPPIYSRVASLLKPRLALAGLVSTCIFSCLVSADDFRPTFHFVPDKNWMNEPNGLIKIGSTWHLFFQHNPNGNYWGDLSWGHATSTDLVNWKHLPVALGNENGIESFTGTSYSDESNISGLGTDNSPPYLAFYTGYFPETGVQDQRMAFSVDEGATWTKYEGNPVVSQEQEKPHDSTGGLETRDPKVFFHAATDTWVMILCHGGQNKMTFWASADTREWTWQSDFNSSHVPNLPGDVEGWEVPDFFQLAIEDSTETKWVMLVTPAKGSPAGGNGVFGITGSFNGIVFTADPVDPATMWLDYGRDFDGALSWENVPTSDGRKVIASVMNSYGDNPPTETWKGMLSFPRTLKLENTGNKLRFLQEPVAELDAFSTSLAHIANQTLAPGQTLLSDVYGRALDVQVSFVPSPGSELSLAVRKSQSEETVIRYTHADGTLSVDRRNSGDISWDPAAGGVHETVLTPDTSGVVRLRVLVDECSIEVYGGSGEVVISNLIFPATESDGVSLTVSGGNAVLHHAEVFEIAL